VRDNALDHVTELLSPYLDGQVTLLQRHAVEAHLSSCETCRAELEALRSLQFALRQLPHQEVPRSFVLGPRSVRPPALNGTLTGFAKAVTSIAASLAVIALSTALAIRGLPRQVPTVASAPLATPAFSPATAVRAAAPAPAASAAARAAAPAAPASAVARAAAPAPAAPAAARSTSAQAGAEAANASGAPRPASVDRSVPGSGGATSTEAPVNVPRLAGEITILLGALGLALYSIRWWRIH
jgi:anti-sigma factor RsiW